MTTTIDPASIPDPAVIEVSSPHCAACRALRPDLEAVAAAFAGRVRLIRLDAGTDLDALRRLRVMGTPTLIGVRDSAVMFRITGRRSRDELVELFRVLDAGGAPAPSARIDTALRVGGGLALAIAGLLAGPAWPLVAGGALIASYGLVGSAWRR